ncbi:MAG: tRNA (N6-threonylcarbamoyladenosine(37)-N6)-methyltransferase TrmO [Desulfobacterium sp.]|nr:tRNA (N6-threonylcarbamoyladenosine(37)-N6)-methyltransferase TrmO [Desulfobacterium sp.]
MEFQSDSNLALFPVGLVSSEIKTPFLRADQNGIAMEGRLEKVKQDIQDMKHKVSLIIILPELSGLLTGIDQYSHLVILYWAHKVPEQNRAITQVHPMGRKENPKVGIFCTSSPVRPNPILTTVVKLVAQEGNVLKVTGLDAIDQSLVLDIKPYVKDFYPQEKTEIPDWMARIIAEVHP